MGGLDFVNKPVERQRLLMDPWPAVGPSAGINQVTIVIPLDVADLVLGKDVEDRISNIGIALRDSQVDHLLVSRFNRQPVTGGHDPVRMLARGSGVEVDHLRLEPEPKLHAEPGYLIHYRMQPVRPDLG